MSSATVVIVIVAVVLFAGVALAARIAIIDAAARGNPVADTVLLADALDRPAYVGPVIVDRGYAHRGRGEGHSHGRR